VGNEIPNATVLVEMGDLEEVIRSSGFCPHENVNVILELVSLSSEQICYES
jgi:hypothetical protein